MAYLANMTATTYTEKDVRKRFRDWVEQQGSQRAAAKSLKVTVGYVNDMMHGRRPVNDKALRKIGIRRSVKEVYESR